MHACGSPDVSKTTVYESCKDLNLQNEQFAAVQEHFTATLQALKLPLPVISEAEGVLAGAKKQALGLEDGSGKPVVNPNSVYSRIGGEEAIDSCVEILYGKVSAWKIDGVAVHRTGWSGNHELLTETT